jgi:hypothetical protein
VVKVVMQTEFEEKSSQDPKVTIMPVLALGPEIRLPLKAEQHTKY